MPRVILKEGDRYGRCTVTHFNIEPFVTELLCDCGNRFTKRNAEVKNINSCGKCPRIWIKGETFGKWTVIDWLPDAHSRDGTSVWKVQCDCGTVSERHGSDLRRGDTTHCGCSPVLKKPKDITGKKIGKLTAVSCTGTKSSNGDYIWNFICDCGNTTQTTIGRFNYGRTKSCGCLVRDKVRSRSDYHGMQDTQEYNSWRKMRERCNNPNDIMYPEYGGKGITVCPRWDESFLNFYEDMGDAPKGFTVDRINTHGNYEPDNCRWGSRYVQSRNRGSYTGTSKFKGVQWEESSGKWIATISVGQYKSKKIGRYVSEDVAAKAYNLASEMIFGEGNDRLELNPVDKDYSKVNTNCKFFNFWVHEMKELMNTLYEE